MNSEIRRYIAIGLFIGAVLGSVFFFLNHRNHVPEEKAIAVAKTNSAIAGVVHQKSDSALSARIVTVTKYVKSNPRVDTVWAKPVTRVDTINAVNELPKVQAQYNSCREQLDPLLNECAIAKLNANAKIHADSITIGEMQKALDKRTIPSRFSFGVNGGYGVMDHNGTVIVGPTVSVGFSYRVF